jgi:hypothetical protein
MGQTSKCCLHHSRFTHRLQGVAAKYATDSANENGHLRPLRPPSKGSHCWQIFPDAATVQSLNPTKAENRSRSVQGNRANIHLQLRKRATRTSRAMPRKLAKVRPDQIGRDCVRRLQWHVKVRVEFRVADNVRSLPSVLLVLRVRLERTLSSHHL